MNPPTFIVLAGGIGKRFYPLKTNKTMVPLMGKPILQHTLEMIERVGGKKAIVVTNEFTRDWVENYHPNALEISAIDQPEALGMADALMRVVEHIGDSSIVVMNAHDMVEDSLLTDLLAKAPESYSLVAGKRMEHYFPGGYLEVNSDRVVSIVEKPGAGNEPSDMINLVFHYFQEPQKFISLLQETNSESDDVYEKALDQLMKDHSVGFIPYDGHWQALKYPHMLLAMMELLFKKNLPNTEPIIDPSAEVAQSAVVQGAVIIEAGAKIYEHAVIKGPAYIGENAIVGDYASVRESVVEERAVIGLGSEVTRSYIGPHCALHHNFIGDSILESNINPSFGTVLANWRIDNQTVSVDYGKEKIDSGRKKMGSIIADGVFLGVNCSIMPGVTIGADARVFPGMIIFDAIEEKAEIKNKRQ